MANNELPNNAAPEIAIFLNCKACPTCWEFITDLKNTKCILHIIVLKFYPIFDQTFGISLQMK